MSKILFENSNIEFIDGDRGKNYPKQEDFSDKGHCMFLSAKNVTSCGFNFDNKVFISSEKDNQLKAGKLKRNDIVITTRGTIGNVAIYDDKVPYNDVRINSGMLILRADSNKLDTKFLYYYLSSKEFKEQVNSLISGSAVPQLPIRDIKKLTLPNITKKQQEKIANIISSFEDRIELNTQINQTLEQIAQALFKSWFVDFDPVRAKVQALSDGLSLEQAELAAMQTISGKTSEELTALLQTHPERYAELAETAKAFPCEMVEIDGVEVPKGWKTIPFKDFIKEKKEKVGNLKNIPEYSVTNNGIIPRSQKFNKQLSKNPEKNKLLHKTDLVFGMSREILNWGIMVDDIGSVSSAYHVYSIDKNVINHIYLKMMMMNKFQYFNELIRPSSREGQSFDKELLKEKTVTVPSNFLLDHFLYKLELLNNQINTIKKETKTLISIRDTLLPELLNGEI